MHAPWMSYPSCLLLRVLRPSPGKINTLHVNVTLVVNHQSKPRIIITPVLVQSVARGLLLLAQNGLF